MNSSSHLKVQIDRNAALLALVVCIVAAAAFECDFKQIHVATSNESHLICEFNKVNYNARELFKIDTFHTLFVSINGSAEIFMRFDQSETTTTVKSETTTVLVESSTVINATDSETTTEESVTEVSTNTDETTAPVGKNRKRSTPEIFTENQVENDFPRGPIPTFISMKNIDDHVTQVVFKSSKLSSVPNIIFHKFKNLQIFDASDVQLRSVNSLTFNNAANLLSIFLQKNRISTVNNFCFVHTKKLKVLDLSDNEITKVQENAFNSLHNLEKLSLSNNYIKTLHDETFQSLVSVEWIWLDRNKLSMICSDLFSQANVKLNGLFLNNNEISEISPYVFDNLGNLRFLMLNGNKCINQNFKSFVIQDNSGIKMELRDCFKNYQKFASSKEDKFDIMLQWRNLNETGDKCVSEKTRLEDVLNNISDQMAKLAEDDK